MIIAVDYSLAKNHSGGMGVFVNNIIKELKKIDKKNKYVMFTNPNKFQNDNIISKIISTAKEHLWYQTIFPLKLVSNKVDILYSPNPPIPFFFMKPIILTIPDMAFYYESSIPIFTKIYLFLEYYLAAKKARNITTFSEYSKKDIIKILNVKPDKISVIPLAASNKFIKNINNKEIAVTLKKYNITKPFILCTPGSFLPRKNVNDLLIATSSLPKIKRDNLQIVLVGNNKGLHYKNLLSSVKKLNLKKNVTFTGYIKAESKDLINLYSSALLFVYPSLYEGFGLPPLEAMRVGIPVIVYNRTSLPEVVNNAGLIVNNSSELKLSILQILNNQKLRSLLVKKGLQRAKKFDWKSSAVLFNQLI